MSGANLNVEWKDWLCGTEGQGMLVLGAFKGHVTPEIEVTITGSSMNTDLVVIPGGMTSQLQVLNVVVKKPFKTTSSSCMVSGS